MSSHLSVSFFPPVFFRLGAGILHSIEKATQLVHGTPKLAASQRTWESILCESGIRTNLHMIEVMLYLSCVAGLRDLVSVDSTQGVQVGDCTSHARDARCLLCIVSTISFAQTSNSEYGPPEARVAWHLVFGRFGRRARPHVASTAGRGQFLRRGLDGGHGRNGPRLVRHLLELFGHGVWCFTGGNDVDEVPRTVRPARGSHVRREQAALGIPSGCSAVAGVLQAGEMKRIGCADRVGAKALIEPRGWNLLWRQIGAEGHDKLK